MKRWPMSSAPTPSRASSDNPRPFVIPDLIGDPCPLPWMPGPPIKPGAGSTGNDSCVQQLQRVD